MTNFELCTELVHAVWSDDTDLALSLLCKGAYPNAQNEDGDTVLLYAVRSNNIALTWLLLEKGADPNVGAKGGNAPLLSAIQSGNTAIMELLLKKGANPNVGAKEGNAPLLNAVQSGNTAMIGLLLEKGADPNVGAKEGNAPLLSAVQPGNTAMTELLLDKGADPNVRTKEGNAPLLSAVQSGNTAMVELLLDKGADPNVGNKEGHAPLLSAIQSGNTAMIKLLLDKGADPNARMPNGEMPLTCAIGLRDTKLAQLLLDKGANPCAPNSDRRILLLYTVFIKNAHFVEFVLSKGLRDTFRESANNLTMGEIMRIQCLGENSGVSERKFEDGIAMTAHLIQHLADRSIVTNLNVGDICITYAIHAGSASIIRLLLEYGVNFNKQRPQNTTLFYRQHPLVQAVQFKQLKCLKVLLQHTDVEMQMKTFEREPWIRNPVMAAVDFKSHKSLRMLLSAGFSTEIRSECASRGLSILQFGTFARILLYRHYCTPLFRAVERKNGLMVKLLIKFGAKMVYTKKCHSPFLYAVVSPSYSSVVRYFLENNVNINAISDANKYKVPDVLLCLLEAKEDIRAGRLRRLLGCGLDPALKHWCKCTNGISLMNEVLKEKFVANVPQLLKLLLEFSPGIPRCCNEVAKAVGANPEVPCLKHLCRLSIRKGRPTSQLENGKFLRNLPIRQELKKELKNYLAYGMITA